MNREEYLRRLGEDLEPGGRRPAPPPLRLVQKFVNTHNHELDPEWDRLGSPSTAGKWLIDNSLLDAGWRLSDEDVHRLHRLRESIRSLAGAPIETRTDSLGPIGDVFLRVRVDDGTLHLEPTGSATNRVAGSLLGIVHDAMIEGSWLRLKPCRECSWLFFDNSRNRSGDWCSMAVCGNRHKNRVYRRRNLAR